MTISSSMFALLTLVILLTTAAHSIADSSEVAPEIFESGELDEQQYTVKAKPRLTEEKLLYNNIATVVSGNPKLFSSVDAVYMANFYTLYNQRPLYSMGPAQQPYFQPMMFPYYFLQMMNPVMWHKWFQSQAYRQ